MLDKRGTPEAESDFSWTVDFTARYAQAREAMQPHLAEVETQKAEAVTRKDELNALRKANADEAKLNACREALAAAEKAAREAQAKADAIDAACYDLKAVNPRARVARDARTAAEIIESINQHGRTVTTALARLQGLVRVDANIAA